MTTTSKFVVNFETFETFDHIRKKNPCVTNLRFKMFLIKKVN